MDDLTAFLRNFCGAKGDNPKIFELMMECLTETIEKYPNNDVPSAILNKINDCEMECLNFPGEYGKDLLGHQSDAVKHLMVNHGIIAAFATGTGKTITAVSTAACLHYVCKFLSKPINIVAVTPASLTSNMEREFKTFPYFARNPGSFTVIGSEMFRRIVLAKKYKAMYLKVYLDTAQVHQAVSSYANNSLVLDDSTFLIVDEAHEFKTDWDFTFHDKTFGGADDDDESRARVFMEDVAPKVWKMMLMTATPALNRWYDIMNLLSAVKDVPRKDYKSAIKMVSFSHMDPEIWKKTAPKLTAAQRHALGEKLALDHYFVDYPIITKGEMFKNAIFFKDVDYSTGDFPTRTDQYVDAVMTNDFYRAYSKVVESHKKKRDASEDEAAQSAFTLQKKISTIPNNPKIELLLSYISSLKYKKLSIYSRFVGPLEGVKGSIENVAKANGYQIFMITGKLNKTQKDQVLKEYNASERSIIFLSDAGGQGLDFKGINVSITYEPGINESREEQFIGRAVRYRSHAHLPPEERTVDVIHLVMKFPPNINAAETPDQSLIANALKKSLQSQYLINQIKQNDSSE